MPPPQSFPKDDQGQYVTLSMLKELENGDISDIIRIDGPHEQHDVPADVVQSGPDVNHESFDMRFHFKQQKEIFVFYARHDDGQIYRQRLDKLKQRGFSIIQNKVSILPFEVIAEFVNGTNYSLTKITGDYGSKEFTIQSFQEMLVNGGSNFEFSYTSASVCFLEFTSLVAYEPKKTFTLKVILSKQGSLKLNKLSLKEIQDKADESLVVPLSLILKDANGVVVDNITLCGDDANVESDHQHEPHK
jgi:hypothetical protein